MNEMKRIAVTIVSELETVNKDGVQIDHSKVSIPIKKLARMIFERGRGLWQRPESLVRRGLPHLIKEIRPSLKCKRERGQSGTVKMLEWNPQPTAYHVRKQKSPQEQEVRVLQKVIE